MTVIFGAITEKNLNESGEPAPVKETKKPAKRGTKKAT